MSVIQAARELPDLNAIASNVRAHGLTLSPALIFGLGAGLYFEYWTSPHSAPSRMFTGHNRHLQADLLSPVAQWMDGDPPGAIFSALRANALAMNLDRAPTMGIMGMEMLAADLEDWAELPDWSMCAQVAARQITDSESLYRRLYVEFLGEAAEWFAPAQGLASALEEVADEWDSLAVILNAIADAESECGFSHAGRMMRRIAAREEHFWGEVMGAISD